MSIDLGSNGGILDVTTGLDHDTTVAATAAVSGHGNSDDDVDVTGASEHHVGQRINSRSMDTSGMQLSSEALLLPLLQVLGKVAQAAQGPEGQQRLVASGVPRLVVRLMGWARVHKDDSVMMQVRVTVDSVPRCRLGCSCGVGVGC